MSWKVGNKRSKLALGMCLLFFLGGAIAWVLAPTEVAIDRKVVEPEDLRGAGQRQGVQSRSLPGKDEDLRSSGSGDGEGLREAVLAVARKCSVKVTVLANGLPLPGAEVWVFEGASSRRAPGQTNENGALTVAIACSGYRGIGAYHDKYAPGTAALPAGEEQATVRLGEASCIAGRVDKQEVPFTEHAVVLAWPTSQPPSQEQLRKVVSGEARIPWIHSAGVGSEGAYELCGLGKNHAYTVVAGDNGWVVHDMIRGVRPGDRVEIKLDRVFGAVIGIQDRSGNPGEFSERFLRGYTVPKHLHDAFNSEKLDEHGYELIAAGFSGDEAKMSTDDLVFLYRAHETGAYSDAIGPLEVQFSAIDGAQRRRSVELTPIDQGINVVVETLDVAFEAGDVALYFWPPASWPEMRPGAGNRTIGYLSFGSSLDARVRCEDMLTGFVVVEGVPAGEYECSFFVRGTEDVIRTNPQKVVVEKGGYVELYVELPPTGAIELVPVGEYGELWSGGMVAYAKVPGGGYLRYGMSAPPYILGGLQPGPYEILVESEAHGVVHASALGEYMIGGAEELIVPIRFPGDGKVELVH